MSDWDQTFTPTAPTFLPHTTPKFLVSKGKKNTSTKKTKFSNRFGWVFKVPSLTSIKSPLHLLNKSEKEKEKLLLEDEVDHLKCAFSVHQESECNVQNCLGTDHWDNESSPSALSSGSLQTFPHPWWAPWPKHQEKELPRLEINALKGTARSEHAAASAHKPRAIPALFSSFHRVCRCITTAHPCRHSTAILRQPGSSALSVCSWITIYLSVVLLKTWNYSLFFPGFLLNLLEKKKEIINDKLQTSVIFCFQKTKRHLNAI